MFPALEAATQLVAEVACPIVTRQRKSFTGILVTDPVILS